MRVLLDTHVFIWATMDSPKLNSTARSILSNASEVYVSVASIWEIAIKARLGKIKADSKSMAQAIESSGFIELPISAQHAIRVEHLPFHHHDPFDRLLIAQTMAEPLQLITADSMLGQYTDLVTLI